MYLVGSAQRVRFPLDTSTQCGNLRVPIIEKSSICRFGEKLLRVRDRKEVYYCYQCERQKRKQLLPKLSGNTGAHQHLLRHHNIDGDGRPKSHPPAGQHGIDENTFTLVSVAKKYQNQGVALGDLINEGNLGLIRAAHKFDETKGIKFISYAVWWIRQAILQALAATLAGSPGTGSATKRQRPSSSENGPSTRPMWTDSSGTWTLRVVKAWRIPEYAR